MRSLDFYQALSDMCCVDHYRGDCCSDEPHQKHSLLAWAWIDLKQGDFISLRGIGSALEGHKITRTFQTPSPGTVGA